MWEHHSVTWTNQSWIILHFFLSIFQGNSESSEVGYMGMATYNLRKINNFIKEVNLKKNIFLN